MFEKLVKKNGEKTEIAYLLHKHNFLQGLIYFGNSLSDFICII